MSTRKDRKLIDPISLREICDSESTISSTRWAFASIVKFNILVILLTIIAGLVAHFVPSIEDFDSSFYGSIAMLLGVLTGFSTGAKIMQGFETKKDDKVPPRQANSKQQNDEVSKPAAPIIEEG